MARSSHSERGADRPGRLFAAVPKLRWGQTAAASLPVPATRVRVVKLTSSAGVMKDTIAQHVRASHRGHRRAHDSARVRHRTLLTGARMDCLPPGAIVVNVARSALLDETALTHRLDLFLDN